MTPEDFDFFKSRVSKFISGSQRGIRFGSSVAPRYTRLSSIIPKRTVPQQVLETIQRGTVSDGDDGIETTSRGITSLGKVTLNLEQTKNNLDKITQLIVEDYKNTQEQNKKELDEYRKRIANRGRIFGKRELGDKKSDILGTIKKYVGSFFSGTGGAIRALAMFNLLQGILSGDPSKIVGPLLGIGMTYIPSIIGSVIGGVIGGVGSSLAGKLFGGGARVAGGAAAGAAGASRFGGLAKFGGRAALLGGGLALASGLFNRPQEEATQQRLEQLTERQKGLVGPQTLVPLPQDDLKKFERLNKRFEEALDFLLKKQKEGGIAQGQKSGAAGQTITPTDTSGSFAGSTASQQAFTYFKSKGLSDEDAAAIVGNLLQENRAMDPTLTNSIGMKGIAQWDANRWAGLQAFAASKGLDPNKRETQLQYVYYEFATGKGGLGLGRLKETSGLEAKTKLVRKDYERPGESEAMDSRRLQYARDVLKLYSGVTPTGTPPTLVSTPRPLSQRNVPALSGSPNVTVVPVPVNVTPQQQTSAASSGNSIVPPIDTTYPENFLALYSKLIYQIV
jgi:hypothetical protein